jgi:hypothetical protein
MTANRLATARNSTESPETALRCAHDAQAKSANRALESFDVARLREFFVLLDKWDLVETDVNRFTN